MPLENAWCEKLAMVVGRVGPVQSKSLSWNLEKLFDMKLSLAIKQRTLVRR